MDQRAELNRLFWHSRRGMLELDLILVPFLQQRYEALQESDQALYRRLLTCEDQDLFKWFIGRETPPDKELSQIVNVILDFARTPEVRA